MNNIFQLMTDNVSGATFISITTNTTFKMNKTIVNDAWTEGGDEPKRIPNPHYGRVRKVTEGLNVMVYQNKTTNAYENMVNKRLVEEGFDPKSFTVGPRTWGTRIPNTPFIEYKGQHYLEVICINPGTTTHLLDGQPVKIDTILGQPPKPPKSGQGGLVNRVIPRTFNISSIVSMKVNKQTYDNLMFDMV